jgi:hypothetical protein
LESGIVVQDYNPSTQKLKQEDYEFKISLDYISKTLSQKIKSLVEENFQMFL